jgi:type II secretory pathway pseudopilin PulG
MLSKLKRNNGGDTIVEVMIVLAVLGLAIGISYATANRSLLNARQAQENSQATELTQSQTENLRFLAPTSAPTSNPVKNIFAPSQPYCIKDVRSVTPFITDPAQCGFGTNNLYTILIYSCDNIANPSTTPCKDVSDANTLVVQAKWDDVSGQGTDTVTLVYKDHAL